MIKLYVIREEDTFSGGDQMMKFKTVIDIYLKYMFTFRNLEILGREILRWRFYTFD